MKHAKNIAVMLISLLIFSVVVFWVTTGFIPSTHPSDGWRSGFAAIYLCVAFFGILGYAMANTENN